MILDDSFRYRGLSMTELDDMIYAHKMHTTNNKPLLLARHLAQAIMTLIKNADKEIEQAKESDIYGIQACLIEDIESACRRYRAVVTEVARLLEVTN
jgi:hypothetical protein